VAKEFKARQKLCFDLLSHSWSLPSRAPLTALANDSAYCVM
jgi:hypothetical protein